jgi:maltodextrin utilization protein YvdJ
LFVALSFPAFSNQPQWSEIEKLGKAIPADLPASALLKFTPADYSSFTGKKMSGWQRISLGILKIKVKREMKKNPDLLLSDFYQQNKKLSVGLIIVIVLLAFLLLFLIVMGIGYKGGL